jgi:hypothetical protein
MFKLPMARSRTSPNGVVIPRRQIDAAHTWTGTAAAVSWPHGFYVDRDGDVWVTDIYAGGGIAQTVIKFAPNGEVLMTLGKPGVAGADPGMFNQPSDVVISKNGDIYVADGATVTEPMTGS